MTTLLRRKNNAPPPMEIKVEDEKPITPPLVDAVPALPDRYTQEVQLGMVRYNQTLQERDEYKAKYEAQVLENKQLGIAIDQAAEKERIHVQRVIDEAITHQKSLEAECAILRGEIDRLSRELSDRAGELSASKATEMKLLARIDLVRAALAQTVEEEK